MTLVPRIHTGAAGAAGPLLFLEGTHRAALGEWVDVEVGDPQPGLLAGRHRGAREARGEILIYLDDDVRVSEGWLGGRDSNPDTVVQSHVSYRWTTSQCAPVGRMNPTTM